MNRPIKIGLMKNGWALSRDKIFYIGCKATSYILHNKECERCTFMRISEHDAVISSVSEDILHSSLLIIKGV